MGRTWMVAGDKVSHLYLVASQHSFFLYPSPILSHFAKYHKFSLRKIVIWEKLPHRTHVLQQSWWGKFSRIYIETKESRIYLRKTWDPPNLGEDASLPTDTGWVFHSFMCSANSFWEMNWCFVFSRDFLLLGMRWDIQTHFPRGSNQIWN